MYTTCGKLSPRGFDATQVSHTTFHLPTLAVFPLCLCPMYTQTLGNQPKPHIPTAPPHHHQPNHDHSHTPAATHVHSVVPGSRDMSHCWPDSYYNHRFIIIIIIIRYLLLCYVRNALSLYNTTKDT